MREHLRELPQYHFQREDFLNEFYSVFTSNEVLELEEACHNHCITEEFFMLCEEGEYYIIHRKSGTIINWYKHLGRTNTCNVEGFSLEDLHNFLVLLKEERREETGLEKEDRSSEENYFEKVLRQLLNEFPEGAGLGDVSSFLDSMLLVTLGEAGEEEISLFKDWGERYSKKFIENKFKDKLNERERRRLNIKVGDIGNFLHQHKGDSINFKTYSVYICQTGKEAIIFHKDEVILKLERQEAENNALYFSTPSTTKGENIEYVNRVLLEANTEICSLKRVFSSYSRVEDILLALFNMIEYTQISK